MKFSHFTIFHIANYHELLFINMPPFIQDPLFIKLFLIIIVLYYLFSAILMLINFQSIIYSHEFHAFLE